MQLIFRFLQSIERYPKHRMTVALNDKKFKILTYRLVGIIKSHIPECNNAVYRLDGRTARNICIKENKVVFERAGREV